MKQIKKIKGFGGLRETPKDSRDFDYGAMFGSVELAPEEDFVTTDKLFIKDQGYSDMCAGFACTAVSEDQEGVELSPEYFFSRIKKEQGDWKSWGADLRMACRVAVSDGFIEEKDAPYNLKKEDRDFLANWLNWPENLGPKAKIHQKQAYFKVGGSPSRFEAMRAVLWQNLRQRRAILTGVMWESDWIDAKNGIIPEKPTGSEETPHAIKIFGQKKINGKLYLVAQLSNSASIGDQGKYYFPKSVINKKFTFGSYIFKDIDPELAKEVVWPWWRKIIEKIKSIIKKTIK